MTIMYHEGNRRLQDAFDSRRIYAPRADCDFPEPKRKEFADFKDYIHPRQPTFRGAPNK